MSKTDASPEFERKMQEIGAKYAHMVIPRDDTHRPITEPRYPAWVEESEPTSQVIPAEAVEAAAKALNSDFTNQWEKMPEWIRTDIRREMAAALEAAAPYIRPDFRESNRKAVEEEIANPLRLRKAEDGG